MRDYLNMFGKVGAVGIIIGWLAVVVVGVVLMFDNFIVGLIVLVGGLGLEFVIFKVFLGPNVRQKQLLANGVEATAKIIDMSDTGVTVNQNPMVKFTLEVQPAEGQPFQAQVKTIISRLDVPQFQPGVQVPVVYNPKNLKEVAIGTKQGPGDIDASKGTGALAGTAGAKQQEEMGEQLKAMDDANQEIIAKGVEAPAKIILSTWMGVYVNGQNPLTHFMLEVTPEGKEPFQAETTAVVAEASVPRYQPGKTITVKYMPDDTSRVSIFHS